MRDRAPPKSDKDLLAEWQEYFSSLLNNDNGQAPSDLPQSAAQDLPIHDHPPTLEETLEAIRQMETNKAAGLDCAITAGALQGGGDAMADVIHCFCAEVYSNLTTPDQWIISVTVPLPKKGDLSLMTNYRVISLLSIAAKVYNKILLNRIRDEVDPILRKNQAGFRPGRSCAQQIHILRRVLEGFRDYQLPLVVTFIDFKKALIPSTGKSDFRYLGSMVASGSSDFKRRKSLAWRAFWKLEQLWKSPHISITTKVKLFNTTCVTILLYGCESWAISQDMENKISAFATSCYRVMLNIKRIDHVLNTTVYSMTNTVPLIHLVRHRQLKFLGHIL